MDRDAVRRFMDRFMELAAGATTIGALGVADRSGMLAALAGAGPLTAGEVAEGGGLELRYVEETLSALAATGVVDYDGAAQTFRLPDEHAVVIADEDSPYSLLGWVDLVPLVLGKVGDVAAAARNGGGVPFEAFGPEIVRGLERTNGPSMRVLLTRRWLPAIPDVVGRLEAGGRVADVGCGAGVAAIAMAVAYPKATVVGFDAHAGSVARATANGADTPNVAFAEVPAEDIPLDPGFDLVTMLDVVHDLARPLAALERARDALLPGGTLLVMEPRAEPRLEDELTARRAALHGIGLLHCTTQSLAAGGPGLGPAWGPDRAEALLSDAGFGSISRLPIDNPFSLFFAARV